MTLDESPGIRLVIVKDAVEQVENLLAKDRKVRIIEDESSSSPALWVTVVTPAAGQQRHLQRCLVFQQDQRSMLHLHCLHPLQFRAED